MLDLEHATSTIYFQRSFVNVDDGYEELQSDGNVDNTQNTPEKVSMMKVSVLLKIQTMKTLSLKL